MSAEEGVLGQVLDDSTPEVRKVVVNYPAGHHYVQSWRGRCYFCPFCGKKEVWVLEAPEPDDSVDCACLACDREFAMGAYSGHDHASRQAIEQLRTGVVQTPRGRLGR